MQNINLEIIIQLISLIIIAVGVVMIFDARKITEKWFSFSDRNNGVKILKVIGFIISVVGAIIIILQYK